MNNIIARIACVDDAQVLYDLNEEFNGNGLNTMERIRESLEYNKQEIVFVIAVETQVVGFLCAQIKKSMCYEVDTVELTELYVREEYRRKGLATQLMKYAEAFCKDKYCVEKLELLTGTDNYPAQRLYEALGYVRDKEVHFVKIAEE